MFFIIYCCEGIDSTSGRRNDCLRVGGNFLLIISFIAGFLAFFAADLFFVKGSDLTKVLVEDRCLFGGS